MGERKREREKGGERGEKRDTERCKNDRDGCHRTGLSKQREGVRMRGKCARGRMKEAERESERERERERE